MAAIVPKVERLLEQVLDQKSGTQIDKYLQKWLSNIRRNDKTESNCTLSLFTEWLQVSVTTWSTLEVLPAAVTVPFTLNLTALISENEDGFNQLNKNNFFIKLVKLTKAREASSTASIKLAYIKLLSSFLNHTSGVDWMVASNYWEDVYNFSLTDNDKELVVESTHFLETLLEKTIHHDEDFCDSVVRRIMASLSESVYQSVKMHTVSATNDVEFHSLQPTLNLTVNILEYFLKEVRFANKNVGVVFLFLKHFHLQEQICDFMIIAQDKCLVLQLTKISFIMQFLELYGKVLTKTVNSAEIDASVKRIEADFTTNLINNDFFDVVILCQFGLLYWKLIEMKIPLVPLISVKIRKIQYHDQLAAFVDMAHFCLLLKHCFTISEAEEYYETDEMHAAFIDKLTGTLSENFMRVGVFWRERLVQHPNLFNVCNHCLQAVKESRHHFSKNQAVLHFQILTTAVKMIIKKFPEKVQIFTKEETYFINIFQVLCVLIEDFEIVLKDCFEVIYVLDLAFDFLGLREWSPNLIVQVMTLMNIAIAHNMAPNMALLIENSANSPVNSLGTFLYAKLIGKVPEIKSAALEVLGTAARLSKKKFPSLQKVLMDSELPTLVVKMSACDGESFVRATAIKCLQEMIQVEEIWNNALKSEDLSQKMRDILLNETEGIVRVEAATFMCVAYENQQLPKETLDKVYETMIYSSTTDLHWEVKVRALDFWDKVIKNHLQNQGMIDGSFPNVTFSKEHRKIVTLTDSEIRKRLLKVLSQLSAIGCLGVLMSAIKDDCDMEVSKTAVKITQRLVDLFKKYNVRSDSSAPTSPTPTENGTISMSSGISVDESMDSPASSSNNHQELNEEIIDQIVNSKDVSLLKNVYTPSDYGSVSNYDIQVRKIVTPNEFLQFTQQDLNNIITEKKKWLNGIEDLGSLLDDMLKTYDDDVNNMDCY